MPDSSELIAKVFTAGCGNDQVKVTRVHCLNAHLQGHAFKYHEASKNILGVYPYQIDYIDSQNREHSVRVMVKAKPDQASILRVYQNLLDHSGIRLRTSLSRCLKNSDYSTPNLKEAVLFRDYADQLEPYLPKSLGVYIDQASSYTLRIEKILPSGSVILDPDDDTISRWEPAFSELTLRGIADIHARFFNKHESLRDSGYFFTCDTAVMVQARELWQAFYEFLRNTQTDLMNPAFSRRHRTILDTLPDWYSTVDKQPKTLLYGDVNPQNLAFAKREDGYQLSVFDWERAVISMPQRDLAEHLVYTLPDDFSKEETIAQIELYRRTFEQKSGLRIDETNFRKGLVWMTCDLIINRLPLMMIVKEVANKRRHSVNAYAKAHLLLDYLAR